MTTTTHLGCLVRSFTRCLFQNSDDLLQDLKGVDKMSFTFELGKPFRPFEQLMGVLPEASKELIPSAFQVRDMRFLRFSRRLYLLPGFDVQL